MKLFGSLRFRISALFRRSSIETEMDEELRFHIRHRADDIERSGVSRAEAERRARLEFGGYQKFKEECREEWGVRWLQDLAQDLRYGTRMLRKSPGFTTVAVLTLALGIGANTAVFSVVNAVLLRPLDFPRPEQLVRITTAIPPGAFLAMRPEMQTVDVATYWEGTEFNLTGAGDPVRLTGSSVSAEFFSVLEAKPALGRIFLTGEDKPGNDNVAILSASLWRNKFGGDPNVIGRSITLEGVDRRIVGVMPATFRFPSPKTEVWVPLHFDRSNLGALWGGPFLPVIGRLRTGVPLERGQAEVQRFSARIVSMFPWKMPDNWKGSTLISLQQDFVADVQTKLLVLLGAIGLVLLVACANVASLLLARAAVRQKELALRAALGARRWRICRQLLAESVLLGALGGAAGLLLAVKGLAWLKMILPADTPRLASVTIDWRVMVFTALVALVTGVLFGIAPALHASRTDLTSRMKSGGQQATASASPRLLNALAAAEVALAVILVIAAGLMVKSLWMLVHVQPGFRQESILTARVTPNEAYCAEFARCLSFYSTLEERVRALPGVDDAALVSILPLNGRVEGFAADLEDHPRATDNSAPMIFETAVTPNYFRLMGIPLLKGRGFTAADQSPSAPPVALITAATAGKYWPNQNPIGKHVKPVFVDTWMTVVGVVGDVHEASLSAMLPTWSDGAVYDAYGNASLLTARHGRQQPTEMTLVMRTTVDAASLGGELQQTVGALNPDAPVSEIRTLSSVVTESTLSQRSSTSLFAIFGAMALLLAAVGVYGVMGYLVTQRTHEIGVRLALGAQPTRVLMLVLGQGTTLALVGSVAGVACALGLTKFLSSLLYGVGSSDLGTFVLVPIVLIGIALLACYIQARRAMRVDPMVALRHE
ncbi:MAG: ADOP family duplicated permease [Candidatus Acidiferrales bacterium]